MVEHRVITESPPNIGVMPEGLTGESLSQADMYVRSNLPIPSSPPDGFELIVPGRRSRFITPEQLTGFEEVTRDIVLECAGNGRSFMSPVPSGTPWDLDGASAITVGGHRLTEVLGSLPDGVVEVVFTGADVGKVENVGRIRYQFSITKELAESTTPILATHIGGEPLTILHGAPVRLVVPGHYAMKSVKWLTRVEAVTAPFRGHFVEKYRYFGDTNEAERAPVAEIAVRSVIASPGDGDAVSAGALEIRGSAWSAGSGISKVEVSLDDGATWHEADMVRRETGGRWAPVRWAHTAEVSPGALRIMAKATDEDGAVQPLESRWNGNGYANNVVHRVDVKVED